MITNEYLQYVEITIDTLEGRMVASPGDWIITGVHGEKYPCKPDIFYNIENIISSENNKWKVVNANEKKIENAN